MNQEEANMILHKMSQIIDNSQMIILNTVLEEILADNRMQEPQKSSNDLLDNFIATKRLEGRSEKTMRLYRFTISKLISAIDKNVCTLSTEDIRNYLSTYQTEHGISKDSIDNMRRNLSSFYRWLEDENYIFKSPLRRIHKINYQRIQFPVSF